jgi:hypothetical protein
MAGELVYTSVAKGLNRGESGFCVVARSANISPILLNRLEAMSGYRELFSAIEPRANENPVNFTNTLIVCGKERFKVISRIGFAGLDYSGRSNKIADHLILTEAEWTNAGPAELLATNELFYTKWDSPPIVLPKVAKVMPAKPVVSGVAEYWHEVTGNTGWAEHLIELSRRNHETPLYIITKLGIDNLLLIKEALRLLPINEQWQYTFSTYCSSNIHGINYRWRFIYPDTDIYAKVIANPHIVKFDLNNLPETIYQTATTAHNKTIMGTPLQLRALQDTIIPDRFQPEIHNNKKNNIPHSTKGNKLYQYIGLICAVIVTIVIIRLMTGSKTSVVERPTIEDIDSLAIQQPKSKSTPIHSPGQRTDNNKTVTGKVKAGKLLSIILDNATRRAVSPRRALIVAVEDALNNATGDKVELQLQLAPKRVEYLARQHNIVLNNNFVVANYAMQLNIGAAIEAVLKAMVDGIAIDEFIATVDDSKKNRLTEQILLRLAKPIERDAKDFYENSAEYILGELYVKFKRHYLAFDIQRTGIISKQRKLSSEIHRQKKLISKYNNELTDSGIELDKLAIIKAKRKTAQTIITKLSQQKKQLVNQLKSLSEPEVLSNYRTALLRAFFCFGKNYMAEAEKIIDLENRENNINQLKQTIKNSRIAQQFKYENEFKANLNAYVYHLTLKKIVIDLQNRLEKLSMRLEYNRQHKTFNLQIEDSAHERP